MALQDAVRDRDRTILQLKEQMKYYVAFAENSINGHPDKNAVNEEIEKEMSEKMEKMTLALEEAQVNGLIWSNVSTIYNIKQALNIDNPLL